MTKENWYKKTKEFKILHYDPSKKLIHLVGSIFAY